MPKLTTALLLVFSLGLAGCGAGTPTPPSAPPKPPPVTTAVAPQGKPRGELTPVKLQPQGPGTHLEKLPLTDGPELHWAVSVPKGYDGQKPVPLVVVLHYSGRDKEWYGNAMLGSLVEPAFRELGAILVAPDSVGDDWANDENSAYVRFLAESVKQTYAIDAKKVVVTGFSAGGIGSWYIAAKNPDVFAAAVPVAGQPAGASADDWKVPVYAIHSDKDDRLPVGPTKAFVEKIAAKDKRHRLELLKNGPGHFDVPAYVEPLKGAVAWLNEIWK